MRNDTRQHYRKLQNKVDEFLAGDLSTPFGIREVAEHVHVSYHHLGDIFKTLRCESLGSYIVRRRLERAAMLLSYTTLTLGNVADKTGFSTKHSLSKAFTGHFGISPGASRNQSLYRKHSPNIFLDGISSQAQYDHMLRSDFPFTFRQARLDNGFLVGSVWRIGKKKNVTLEGYERTLRSLAHAATINAHRFCIRAYDSVNFTAFEDFKIFYGSFVEGGTPELLQKTCAGNLITPIKKGDYLVFDVPAGRQEEIKQYITLFRESLVWYKRDFRLHDFFDFFVFSRNDETKTGEYFLYYGS